MNWKLALETMFTGFWGGIGFFLVAIVFGVVIFAIGVIGSYFYFQEKK